MELEETGGHVYHKNNKVDEWRGPGEVIGKDGKVMVVKQGKMLKKVIRVHIISLKGRNEEM